MTDKELIEKHIHSDPAIMVGKPVIRGTRLTVEFILGQLQRGGNRPVLAEYKGLTAAHLEACRAFERKERMKDLPG